MVDIHVIRYHSLRKPELFERCASSLQHPKVKIYEIEGYENPHFGKLRVQGFSKGNSEYVSFVDDDDYLYPNAVDEILNTIGDADYAISGYSLNRGPFASIQPHSLEFSVAKSRPYYIQGFKIIKRSVVEKYYNALEKVDFLEDVFLWLALSKNHRGVIVNKILLHRELHDSNASFQSNSRNISKADFNRLLELLK